MFTLITTLVNGNFNNCAVIRPDVFIQFSKRIRHSVSFILSGEIKSE
jgi:hypothetical protein